MPNRRSPYGATLLAILDILFSDQRKVGITPYFLYNWGIDAQLYLSIWLRSFFIWDCGRYFLGLKFLAILPNTHRTTVDYSPPERKKGFPRCPRRVPLAVPSHTPARLPSSALPFKYRTVRNSKQNP